MWTEGNNVNPAKVSICKPTKRHILCKQEMKTSLYENKQTWNKRNKARLSLKKNFYILTENDNSGKPITQSKPKYYEVDRACHSELNAKAKDM